MIDVWEAGREARTVRIPPTPYELMSDKLVDRTVCLFEMSKDLVGDLALVESVEERCESPACTTLETGHRLSVAVSAHACDSKIGRLLDGRLEVGDLVHKFAGADGGRRGVHEAAFRWRGAGGVVVGTMQGVTNVGTHRAPAFEECQQCDTVGVMEGLLLGTVRKATNRRLIGCELRAAYRLGFDPSKEGGSGAVTGTLEGVIIRDCGGGPARSCIDFDAMALGAGPNPRTDQGVRFSVRDHHGIPLGSSDVRQLTAPTGAVWTGLDIGRSVEIMLPAPAAAIEATVVTMAKPALLTATNDDGSTAGTAQTGPTQGMPQLLSVSGAAIRSIVIDAPAGETILLRLCVEVPTARLPL